MLWLSQCFHSSSFLNTKIREISYKFIFSLFDEYIFHLNVYFVMCLRFPSVIYVKYFVKYPMQAFKRPQTSDQRAFWLFYIHFCLLRVFVLFCSLSRTSYINLGHFLLYICEIVLTRIPKNDTISANFRSMCSFGILFHSSIRMSALWSLLWLINNVIAGVPKNSTSFFFRSIHKSNSILQFLHKRERV